MHTAFVRIKVNPAKTAAIGEAMRALVAPTLAEPGCISYEFYRDCEDPSLFLCFEHWEDREALDRHGSTAHVLRFLNEFGGDIERWDVNHTRAL